MEIERFRGCLFGLAVGDALGTTLEFRSPGTFDPVSDMVGGGPFRLKAGQWTDDTSMALCLAQSLIEKDGFDPVDQMERYVRWWREGHLSSTGRCFDIGNTIGEALAHFMKTGRPFCGPTHPHTAGNGSLMRLAPVPMFYADRPEEAMEYCEKSSRTTHQACTALDACRYWGALIIGALQGVTKDELLYLSYHPVFDYWDRHPLCDEISEIASGSFKDRGPPEIKGTGYVVKSLEAALWAFHRSSSFKEGALLAVNLGDDADTTGAVYGQLAGAFYGEEGIPRDWLDKLCMKELIADYADRLYCMAVGKV